MGGKSSAPHAYDSRIADAGKGFFPGAGGYVQWGHENIA
jgi:hypothetical protein